MPTSTVVSVEEYVSTDYSPDREYLNGAVVKRNLGERGHSRLQTLVCGYILAREKEWRVVALSEQRVQVKASRFRVPDICVLGEVLMNRSSGIPRSCASRSFPETTACQR